MEKGATGLRNAAAWHSTGGLAHEEFHVRTNYALFGALDQFLCDIISKRVLQQRKGPQDRFPPDIGRLFAWHLSSFMVGRHGSTQFQLPNPSVSDAKRRHG